MRLEVYCDKKITKQKINYVRLGEGKFLLSYCLYFFFQLTLSCCVFVFGDDHVTCYVGADVTSGENVEA